jgi:hypothetical protein
MMNCGFLTSFPFLILTVLFGILSCFWGYRAFRVVLGIVGFAVGAYLGAGAGAFFTGGFGIVAVITGLIGGLIGAALVSVVYYVGVFVLGALGGWVIYTMIAGAAGYGPHLILLIILALAGGILALFFQKFLIIVSTAFIGSWCIVSAGFSLLGSDFGPFDLFCVPIRLLRPAGGTNTIVVICWVALGILGSIFQFRFSGGHAYRKVGKPENRA